MNGPLAIANFLKIVFECAHIRKSAPYEQRGLFLVAVTLKNRFFYSFCEWFVKVRFFVSFVNGRETLKTIFLCGRTCKSSHYEVLHGQICVF